MKTITKTVLYLQMTALLLTAALAGSAAAAEELPFHGTIQGIEIADVQFPKLFVDASGSGNATHLGCFTLAYEVEVDLLTHSTFGSSVFTAANGDNVFTDIIGLGTRTPMSTLLWRCTPSLEVRVDSRVPRGASSEHPF
jgi:hypothetical protein